MLVAAAVWLLIAVRSPAFPSPSAGDHPSAPTPAPGGTVAATARPAQSMMGGMAPFRVPPAPTAVTGFYNPAQRQQGAEVYEQRCSTCHGERGQGLTPEWRATWPEGEQNCWQSKCHAANHPPDGFRLPEYVPPVIGGTSLARFHTAPQLFAYLRARMPYHAPGILSDEDYWALTAFLLDAHRVPSDGQFLNHQAARGILIRPAQAVPPTPTVNWRLVVSSGVLLLALASLAIWRQSAR